MNGNDIILYALFTVSATITFDSASKHSVLRAFRAVHPYSFINRVQLPHVKLFGLDYPDANAIDDFRFTISELQDLSEALHIPEVFKTTQRDCVEGYEALAMLCYRLSYPGKWSRVRKAFGRSEASCCRIVLALIDLLDEKWGNLLYFNAELYTSRHQAYRDAIFDKTEGVVDGVSLFIDGTKCAICRPSAVDSVQQALDDIPVGEVASLQRVCYSGHKRKHCLSYQGINAPDGMFLYKHVK